MDPFTALLASSAISTGGMFGSAALSGGGQSTYQPQTWQQIMSGITPFISAIIQQQQADATNAATRGFVQQGTDYWKNVGSGVSGYLNTTGSAGLNYLNQLFTSGNQNLQGQFQSMLYGTPYTPAALPDINTLANALASPTEATQALEQTPWTTWLSPESRSYVMGERKVGGRYDPGKIVDSQDLENRLRTQYADQWSAYQDAQKASGPSQADIVNELQPIYDAYDKQFGQITKEVPKALQGYQGRYEAGMELLKGLGEQSRTDINRQYNELGSKVQSNAVARGLTGSTIPQASQMAVERERSGSLGKLDEALRQEQLNWQSILSGDFLNAMQQGYTGMNNFDTGMGANALNLFSTGVGQRVNTTMDIAGQISNLNNQLFPQGPQQPNVGDALATSYNNLMALNQPGVGSGTVNPYSAALSGSANNVSNALLMSTLLNSGSTNPYSAGYRPSFGAFGGY